MQPPEPPGSPIISSSGRKIAKGSSPTMARAHQIAWPRPIGTCWRTVTRLPGLILVGSRTSSTLPRPAIVASSSKAVSKCSTSAVLPRPVTKISSSMPASRASSTAYWISGRSTIGSSSLGIALVAGRKRVPSPATGNTALRTGIFKLFVVMWIGLPSDCCNALKAVSHRGCNRSAWGLQSQFLAARSNLAK